MLICFADRLVLNFHIILFYMAREDSLYCGSSLDFEPTRVTALEDKYLIDRCLCKPNLFFFGMLFLCFTVVYSSYSTIDVPIHHVNIERLFIFYLFCIG